MTSEQIAKIHEYAALRAHEEKLTEELSATHKLAAKLYDEIADFLPYDRVFFVETAHGSAHALSWMHDEIRFAAAERLPRSRDLEKA